MVAAALGWDEIAGWENSLGLESFIWYPKYKKVLSRTEDRSCFVLRATLLSGFLGRLLAALQQNS